MFGGFGMGMGMGGPPGAGGPTSGSMGMNMGGMSAGVNFKIHGTKSAPLLNVDMGMMGMGAAVKDIPLCTHEVYPGQLNQNSFECRTCNKKICQNCASNCHVGHDVVFHMKEEAFECACDSERTCKLIDHENQQSYAQSSPPPEPEIHAVMTKTEDGNKRLELDPLHSLTLEEAAMQHGRPCPTMLTVGCGWTTQTDLDTQICAFDKDLAVLGSVSYKKKSYAGLEHCGDNRSGSAAGKDAEKIIVDLTQIPANVRSLAISITSFGGKQFTAVSNAFMRLCDKSDDYELMYLDLSAKENKTALFFALLYRGDDGKWELLPALKYFQAKTPEESFNFTKDWIKTDGFIQRMHGNK